MPSYYEMLGVAPAASESEIEIAYERQYNRYRRLVTHHDPTVVTRANQVLQSLEQARATLLDVSARQAYDASIGGGGVVGGLYDPQAAGPAGVAPGPPVTSPMALRMPTALRMPVGRQAVPEKGDRPDAWVCPQCQKPNTIGLRFCTDCGQQIGTECANCGQVIELVAEFCSACGLNATEARRKKEIEAAEQHRQEQEAIRLVQEAEAREAAEARRLARLKVDLGMVGALAGGVAAPLVWYAIWPDAMEEGVCIGIQVVLGLIGGGFASVQAGTVAGAKNAGLGYLVGILAAIVGGVLALPVLACGIIAGVAGG